MAARSISAAEVHAILTDNVIVQVIDHRARFVLLGVVSGRPLIAVVADDEVSDATVLIWRVRARPGPWVDAGGDPRHP
jgi:hypothetical protein